ncbi:class I SAM-dependent methyltransferase [Cupriavidus basilensis]|uniref:class I SAM-dependent methyltransferase n=1 Tax=Cupriavidus basilensis TaxID=68895 RepID=UPI0009E583CF|nr:class I SAM-dependent methyltransferase [Cupriavidus basilensis]
MFCADKRSADEHSFAVALDSKYIRQGDTALEVGSSSGVNLASICRATKCRGLGIDPSGEAVSKGQQLFPELELRVGTADKLEFPDHSLDFSLFGFCLDLVDREHISRVLAEADRCLRDGGWIGITDFMPDVPAARPMPIALPRRHTSLTTVGCSPHSCTFSCSSRHASTALTIASPLIRKSDCARR